MGQTKSLIAAGEKGKQADCTVWDYHDPQRAHPVAELSGHSVGIAACEFTHGDEQLVTAGYDDDRSICVWNIAQQSCIAKAKLKNTITSISWSPSLKEIAVSGKGFIRYFGLPEPSSESASKESTMLRGHSALMQDTYQHKVFADICFGVDEWAENLYAVTSDGKLVQFDNERTMSIVADQKQQHAFAVSCSLSGVAVGYSNGRVRVFTPNDLRCASSMPLPPTGQRTNTKIGDRKAKQAAAGPGDTGTTVAKTKLPAAVGVRLLPGLQKVAVIYGDRTLMVWSFEHPQRLAQYRCMLAHSGPIWGVRSLHLPPTLEEIRRRAQGVWSDEDAKHLSEWMAQYRERGPDASALTLHNAFPNDPMPMGTFVTTALDGTVRFWNLDMHTPTGAGRNASLRSHASDGPGEDKPTDVGGNGAGSERRHWKKPLHGRQLLHTHYFRDPKSSSLSCVNAQLRHPVNVQRDWQTIPSTSGIRSLAARPGARQIAVGHRSGVLTLLNLEDMGTYATVKAHDKEITCLEFGGKTGDILASGSRDRCVHIFDVRTTALQHVTVDRHSGAVTCVLFNPQENVVVTGGTAADICFTAIKRLDTALPPAADASTPGAAAKAVGPDAKCCFEVDSVTQTLCKRGHVNDIAGNMHWKNFLVGCQARQPQVWSLFIRKEVQTYPETAPSTAPSTVSAEVQRVVVDPSGLYCATASADKIIRIRDLFNGSVVCQVRAHSGVVAGLAFTADCRRLISVGPDATIIVWRLPRVLTARMLEALTEIRERAGLQVASAPNPLPEQPPAPPTGAASSTSSTTATASSSKSTSTSTPNKSTNTSAAVGVAPNARVHRLVAPPVLPARTSAASDHDPEPPESPPPPPPPADAATSAAQAQPASAIDYLRQKGPHAPSWARTNISAYSNTLASVADGPKGRWGEHTLGTFTFAVAGGPTPASSLGDTAATSTLSAANAVASSTVSGGASKAQVGRIASRGSDTEEEEDPGVLAVDQPETEGGDAVHDEEDDSNDVRSLMQSVAGEGVRGQLRDAMAAIRSGATPSAGSGTGDGSGAGDHTPGQSAGVAVTEGDAKTAAAPTPRGEEGAAADDDDEEEEEDADADDATTLKPPAEDVSEFSTTAIPKALIQWPSHSSDEEGEGDSTKANGSGDAVEGGTTSKSTPRQQRLHSNYQTVQDAVQSMQAQLKKDLGLRFSISVAAPSGEAFFTAPADPPTSTPDKDKATATTASSPTATSSPVASDSVRDSMFLSSSGDSLGDALKTARESALRDAAEARLRATGGRSVPSTAPATSAVPQTAATMGHATADSTSAAGGGGVSIFRPKQARSDEVGGLKQPKRDELFGVKKPDFRSPVARDVDATEKTNTYTSTTAAATTGTAGTTTAPITTAIAATTTTATSDPSKSAVNAVRASLHEADGFLSRASVSASGVSLAVDSRATEEAAAAIEEDEDLTVAVARKLMELASLSATLLGRLEQREARASSSGEYRPGESQATGHVGRGLGMLRQSVQQARSALQQATGRQEQSTGRVPTPSVGGGGRVSEDGEAGHVPRVSLELSGSFIGHGGSVSGSMGPVQVDVHDLLARYSDLLVRSVHGHVGGREGVRARRGSGEAYGE